MSLMEFQLAYDDFVQTAGRMDEIDRFCSSAHWVLPAHMAFSAQRKLWLRRSEAGYAAFAIGVHEVAGPVLEPLEAQWGAGCPLIGTNPSLLVRQFAQELLNEPRRMPVLICGIKRGGQLFRALRVELASHRRLVITGSTGAWRASLEGGEDGFLSRRHRKFRANLRRAEKVTREAGLTFQRLSQFASEDEAMAAYERCVAVERGSWKGLKETGILEPSMQRFYRIMLGKLWSRGAVRLILAQRDGEDVGYILGAIFQDTYRGLQASYREDLSHLSLGSALHLEKIRWQCEEGRAWYDMGVAMEYKERWAEDFSETCHLLAF